MKHATLLLLALAAMLPSRGQEAKEKIAEHEIGINIYRLQIIPNSLIKYEHQFVNGLIYKRHYGRSALRTGIDLIHYRYDNYYYISDSWCNTIFIKADVGNFTGELRMGYEYAFSSKKLQPFIAGDLIFSYGWIRETQEGYGNFPPSDYYNKYWIHNYHAGIAPTAGLRYKPGSRISFTAESSIFPAFYYRLYHDITYQYRSRFHGLKTYYYALRLFAFSYHF